MGNVVTLKQVVSEALAKVPSEQKLEEARREPRGHSGKSFLARVSKGPRSGSGLGLFEGGFSCCGALALGAQAQ